MNVRKIALCLCVVTLSTQLAAKDLADEKEMVCMVRAEHAAQMYIALVDRGEKNDEAVFTATATSYAQWKNLAEKKFLGQLKVAQSTFDSAKNRIIEIESNLGTIHLGTLGVRSEIEALKEFYKFRLNRLKLSPCLKN
jgi:hypothetical protein